MISLQDLEPSEEDQLLALKLDEETKEVLTEVCPAELAGVNEEDVSS